MVKEKPTHYVQSLDRAIDIIENLVKADKNLGVTELSEKIGLHKSTVHRLLATLAYRGFVEKDDYGQYKVGLKLLEIGGTVLNKMDLRKKTKPYLIRLQEECRETIHLGILDGREVVYIDKEETTETIRMYSEVGKRIEAYCTSLGKVLLAFGGEDVFDLYDEEDFKEYTSNTITDIEELSEHLKMVKRLGYAIDDQEQELGIRCIGGPIFNYNGQVIAAFSIAGPTTRMSSKRVQELSRTIIDYSRDISAAFGYKYQR